MDEALYERIDDYCKSNGFTVSKKCEQWLKNALNKELYGDIPFGKFTSDEETVEEKKTEEKETTVNEPVTEQATVKPKQEKITRPTKRRL